MPLPLGNPKMFHEVVLSLQTLRFSLSVENERSDVERDDRTRLASKFSGANRDRENPFSLSS